MTGTTCASVCEYIPGTCCFHCNFVILLRVVQWHEQWLSAGLMSVITLCSEENTTAIIQVMFDVLIVIAFVELKKLNKYCVRQKKFGTIRKL
jgi:hypothetical protein